MIELEIVNSIVDAALVILVALIALSFVRVIRGKGAADRLVGVDIITTLLIGITVLLALVEQSDTTIDMGIVFAAVSFAGTLSIARYISEGRVF